jgi:hypothetical protein
MSPFGSEVVTFKVALYMSGGAAGLGGGFLVILPSARDKNHSKDHDESNSLTSVKSNSAVKIPNGSIHSVETTQSEDGSLDKKSGNYRPRSDSQRRSHALTWVATYY